MSDIIPVQPIKITINGTVNSGKSTIASLVVRALVEAGFVVSIQDEPLNSLRGYWFDYLEGWHARIPERVEHLKKRGLKINVATEQCPRY